VTRYAVASRPDLVDSQVDHRAGPRRPPN
jgi:hypothetical protein